MRNEKSRRNDVDIDVSEDFPEDGNLKIFTENRQINDRIPRMNRREKSSETRVLRNHFFALNSGWEWGQESEIVVSYKS